MTYYIDFMIKKFDAIEYLVRKYVDDGEHATIPIILKNKNDFFNIYDPTHTSVSQDVYHYLDKCSYNIPPKYKIIIDVVCNDMDDITKVKIQEATRNHYGVKVFDNNIDLKTNNKKAAILSVIGVIIILFVYLGAHIDVNGMVADTTMSVLREVMLLNGWVFLWFAAENIVFDREKLREQKRDNVQMMNADFIFENEKEYYKILKEEEKEVVEEKEEYEEIRDSFLDL